MTEQQMQSKIEEIINNLLNGVKLGNNNDIYKMPSNVTSVSINIDLKDLITSLVTLYNLTHLENWSEAKSLVTMDFAFYADNKQLNLPFLNLLSQAEASGRIAPPITLSKLYKAVVVILKEHSNKPQNIQKEMDKLALQLNNINTHNDIFPKKELRKEDYK